MIRVGGFTAAKALILVFAVVAAAWSVFLNIRNSTATNAALDRLENLSLDWRYLLAGPRPPPRGVAIAAIDDETIRKIGSFPLPRNALAQIVRGIAAHDPQVIAIDLLFLDPGLPEADQELVDALRSTRAVIGAVGKFDSQGQNEEPAFLAGGADAIPRPSGVIWPLDKFRAAARVGLSNISTDEFGVPRYVPLLLNVDGNVTPSFALAAVSRALNLEPAFGRDVVKLGARSVGLDVGYHLPLRFYGPRGTIRTFSAYRAADGELNGDDVHGQVVILGSIASGLGDRFTTPFDRSMPGVEIVATAIGNLLAGDNLVRNRLSRGIDATVSVLLAVGMVLLLAIPNTSLALGLSMLVFALWMVATFVAFLEGYWLSFAVPAAASVPIAVAFGFARLGLAQRAARRFASESETLRRFHAPRVADLLARDPQFLVKPVSQQAAVVFLDLSGFTGVTEALGPAWTRELLAALHDLIETVVTGCRGFVFDYMGDGAMIVFGLPSAQREDACHALGCVNRLFADVTGWLATLPPVAREHLAVRVGGNFGPVVFSRLGGITHQQIAATGDTVNVASRLLEVAKQQHASIAVSEDLFRAATQVPCDAAAETGYVTAEVSIRGRTQPLSVRIGQLRDGKKDVPKAISMSADLR
jgi:adenylate cyclase